MKKFRKLKITIDHLETTDGLVATEMKTKGGSYFRLAEIDKIINDVKRDFFKTEVEFKNGPTLKAVK